jgi:hypothetical protein
LALTLFKQDIEPKGGFARAGHPGQDNELVLGDCQADIFQVVQPRAADEDLSFHLTSRVDWLDSIILEIKGVPRYFTG